MDEMGIDRHCTDLHVYYTYTYTYTYLSLPPPRPEIVKCGGLQRAKVFAAKEGSQPHLSHRRVVSRRPARDTFLSQATHTECLSNGELNGRVKSAAVYHPNANESRVEVNQSREVQAAC